MKGGINMACYDCEDCSKSIQYGGKCKRFEYDCSFVLVENYNTEKLNMIRAAVKNIEESISKLKELDDEEYAENEISSIEFQASQLKDKIRESMEKEWNEINEGCGKNKYERVDAVITDIDRHRFATCPRWQWNITVSYEDLTYTDSGWTNDAFYKLPFADANKGDKVRVEIKTTYIDGKETEKCINRIIY